MGSPRCLLKHWFGRDFFPFSDKTTNKCRISKERLQRETFRNQKSCSIFSYLFCHPLQRWVVEWVPLHLGFYWQELVLKLRMIGNWFQPGKNCHFLQIKRPHHFSWWNNIYIRTVSFDKLGWNQFMGRRVCKFFIMIEI